MYYNYAEAQCLSQKFGFWYNYYDMMGVAAGGPGGSFMAPHVTVVLGVAL